MVEEIETVYFRIGSNIRKFLVWSLNGVPWTVCVRKDKLQVPLELNGLLLNFLFWTWSCNRQAVSIRVCVCSLEYPAWLAHAPYRHLWPVRLYSIFPHYLISGTISGKNYWTVNCISILSTTLSAKFLVPRRIERDMYIGLHVKYPLFLSYFFETWILSTDFEKIRKH